jgi:hypothetical protein
MRYLLPPMTKIMQLSLVAYHPFQGFPDQPLIRDAALLRLVLQSVYKALRQTHVDASVLPVKLEPNRPRAGKIVF